MFDNYFDANSDASSLHHTTHLVTLNRLLSLPNKVTAGLIHSTITVALF